MQEMIQKATEVADIYKVLSNPNRLLILCFLIDQTEMCVSEMAAQINLEQSPLSQHLKIMRDQGFVTHRKEGLTVYYRIADDRLKSLIALTKKLYCE